MREIRHPLMLVVAGLAASALLAVAIWRLWPVG